MPANVAQEIDVVELVEPVGVIAHDGIAAGAFEFQELRKDRADAFEIFVDRIVGEDAAAFILAGRVADTGCAAAHERDRAMTCLLQPIQHHDRQ